MSNEKNLEKKPYDLEDRTRKFGEDIIDFVKKIPRNIITTPLISQFIRAVTAVGGLYCEADCAETRKDFEHKLGICRKESKESKHWLLMIVKAVPTLSSGARSLAQEANELTLIFTSIIAKSKYTGAKKAAR